MNSDEDRIRALASRAIRRCDKKREDIVKQLSNAVGETITVSMLNEITRARRFRETDGANHGTRKIFTVEWLVALARITSSHELEQFALCDDCRRALAVGKLGIEGMAKTKR